MKTTPRPVWLGLVREEPRNNPSSMGCGPRVTSRAFVQTLLTWAGQQLQESTGQSVLLTRSLTNFKPQQFEAILLRTILLQAPQLLPGSDRTFCSMVLPAAFHAEPRNASSSLCSLESSPRQAHPELALSAPCSTEVC